MIIKTNFAKLFGADAITIFPFIFTSMPDNFCLIAHETVHYKEQKKCLVIPWWIAYLIWPSFRLQAEIRAYKVQIVCGGITVEQAGIYLSQKYMLNISFYESCLLLKNQ